MAVGVGGEAGSAGSAAARGIVWSRPEALGRWASAPGTSQRAASHGTQDPGGDPGSRELAAGARWLPVGHAGVAAPTALAQISTKT